MVSVCARIGTLLALALGGVALIGGCGALPADWGDPASWTAAGIWSGQATGDVGDDGSSTADADTADTDGEFLTVVSGTEQIRVLVQAGDDQVVNAGAHVVLDGSATRSGAPMELQYYWSQLDGPAVTLDAPESLRPNFRAPAATADLTLIFELRVSLGTQSARDTVAITVLGSGEPDSPPDDGVSPEEEPPPPEDPYPPPPAFEPPVAYAADWGFDPEDSTEYIQAAINSGARTVVIQNMGADWVIKPVKFASNQLVVFEPGVVVAAKPGSFQGPADCLMRGMIVSNVTLWGYGATLRMRREDYIGPDYEHGQWRHCLSFQGSDNVSILGLRCEQSGGDGIYIGAGDGIPATNILIRDCTCDYNYRQGISVTSAQSVHIENCVLSNTQGNPPQAGIDLECNFAGDTLSDIVVSNCVSQNNAGPGFVASLKNLTAATAPPVSVLFENCQVIDCGSWSLAAVNDADTPPTAIEFRNCSVQGGPMYGIWARWLSPPEAQLLFTNCVLTDTANDRRSPINFEMPHATALSYPGRIRLDNCTVYDSQNRHFITIFDIVGTTGVFDVHGTVNVYNSLDNPSKSRIPAAELPDLTAQYFPWP